MGFLDKLKETVDVATGKKPPDLSRLSPKERERYEKNVAAQKRALDEAEAEWRTLDELEIARREALVVEDDSPMPPTAAERRALAESGAMAQLKDALKGSGSEAWKVWSPAKLTRALANEMKEEALGRSLSDGRSPEERARLAAEERSARAAARAPYRAPNAPRVTISRVATRGGSQLDDVRRWLAATGLAARPDLVWSVHRVPDRISPNVTPQSERGRVVEWEVVHQPVTLAPTDAAVAMTTFDRGSRWIARRIGEHVPLDEDVAAWFAEWADLGPSRCFGMPRVVTMRSYGDGPETSGTFAAVVGGVSVLHVSSPRAEQVAQHLRAERPVRPPERGRLRVDRLDWAALREHVHPVLNGEPTIPSPKSRLPSTPQELLLAYLEVVGIASSDCASAAVTTDDAVLDGALALGPSLPVADGTPRRRARGAREVVVVYEDRPVYAEGRERWAAYQAETLRARPAHLTSTRQVLDVPSRGENAFRNAANVVEALVNPFEWLDRVVPFGDPPFVPYPYCWPPTA